MLQELSGMGLWIDSSELSVDETVALILASWSRALLEANAQAP